MTIPKRTEPKQPSSRCSRTTITTMATWPCGCLRVRACRRRRLRTIRTSSFAPRYVGSSGWIGVELSRIDDDRLGVDSRGVSVDRGRRSGARRRERQSDVPSGKSVPFRTERRAPLKLVNEISLPTRDVGSQTQAERKELEDGETGEDGNGCNRANRRSPTSARDDPGQ